MLSTEVNCAAGRGLTGVAPTSGILHVGPGVGVGTGVGKGVGAGVGVVVGDGLGKGLGILIGHPTNITLTNATGSRNFFIHNSLSDKGLV